MTARIITGGSFSAPTPTRANDRDSSVEMRAPTSTPVEGDVGAALRLWRLVGPSSIGPESRGAIARALSTASLRWPASWRQAMLPAADAAACVNFAIDFLDRADLASRRADEVMSTMMIRAFESDISAAGVIANGLATLSDGHAESERLMRLSGAWSLWMSENVACSKGAGAPS